MKESPSQAMVRKSTPELDAFARVGKWLAVSEGAHVEDQARHMAAAMRLYVVHELGLAPTAAFGVSIVKGKPMLSSELARALAARAGYRVVAVELNDLGCTAAVVDRETGETLGASTFTMDDAKRAGLVRSGGAWETYPRRMLWARAAGYAIRDYAPEVLLGFRTDDELTDLDPDASEPTPEREPVDMVVHDVDLEEAEWDASDPEPEFDPEPAKKS